MLTTELKRQLWMLGGVVLWVLLGGPGAARLHRLFSSFPSEMAVLSTLLIVGVFFRAWKAWRDQKKTF